MASHIYPNHSNKLFGLDKHFEELKRLYYSNTLPKALLLSSNKGNGKFTLISHFLNSIFDKEYNEIEKLINSSSPTFLKINNCTFQNIIYLKNAKIEDIRDLKETLSKTLMGDGHRFIILDEVEMFNLNCLNALLKLIEEPSINNYFILIDNKQKKLLETISSRCLKTNFFLKEDERIFIIKNLMEKNNIENKFDYFNLHITPGSFFLYNEICVQEKISFDTDILHKTDKLLKLNKKNKSIGTINLLKFFIEKYFYDLSVKKYKNISLLNNKKIESLKKINNFVSFNTNLNSTINSIFNQLNV